MRLINAKITGFRRFENVNINLDSRIVAIVGPNEAGKSSLLQALLSLNASDPFNKTDLSRGMSINDEDTVVEALFLLDEEERNFARGLDGVGDPKWYISWKKVNGKRHHRVEP